MFGRQALWPGDFRSPDRFSPEEFLCGREQEKD
jgi:hypothetical protein